MGRDPETRCSKYGVSHTFLYLFHISVPSLKCLVSPVCVKEAEREDATEDRLAQRKQKGGVEFTLEATGSSG